MRIPQLLNEYPLRPYCFSHGHRRIGRQIAYPYRMGVDRPATYLRIISRCVLLPARQPHLLEISPFVQQRPHESFGFVPSGLCRNLRRKAVFRVRPAWRCSDSKRTKVPAIADRATCDGMLFGDMTLKKQAIWDTVFGAIGLAARERPFWWARVAQSPTGQRRLNESIRTG